MNELKDRENKQKSNWFSLSMGLLVLLGVALILLLIIFKEAFNNLLIFLIVVSYLIFSIGLIFKKNIISFLGYILVLNSVLFVRSAVIDDYYTSGKYIFSWLNILFTNKIVFINVFGNLVLYSPLWIYMVRLFNLDKPFKKLVLLVIIIGFITINEYFQYLFKIGVFDISDIIINTIGVIITLVIDEGIKLWMKKIKTKKI